MVLMAGCTGLLLYWASGFELVEPMFVMMYDRRKRGVRTSVRPGGEESESRRNSQEIIALLYVA